MEKNKTKTQTPENCPKCASELGAVMETKTGKQFQRCSTGSWNPETRSVDGCDFIKWITPEPKELEEKCPKCGAALLEAVTKFGKKLKKCSTNKWDPETRTQTGCDYVEWAKGVTEQLNEECPQCSAPLVMYTSAAGKKMKKCSTNQWDPKTKASTGCTFIEWQK